MPDVPTLVLVLSLAGAVLWLAHRGFLRVARPDRAGMHTGRLLMLLFAWSFILGAVMRWVRL